MDRSDIACAMCTKSMDECPSIVQGKSGSRAVLGSPEKSKRTPLIRCGLSLMTEYACPLVHSIRHGGALASARAWSASRCWASAARSAASACRVIASSVLAAWRRASSASARERLERVECHQEVAAPMADRSMRTSSAHAASSMSSSSVGGCARCGARGCSDPQPTEGDSRAEEDPVEELKDGSDDAPDVVHLFEIGLGDQR